MKKIFTLALAVVMISALLSSCKKEYNVTQTVNQAYSFTETIQPATWTISSDNFSFGVEMNLDASNGFPSDFFVSDLDAVLVYVDFNNNGTWIGPLELNDGAYNFRAYHGSKYVGIEYYKVDGSNITSADRYPGPLKVKVVVIQNADMNLKSSVNTKDYNAVKKAFNLKD